MSRVNCQLYYENVPEIIEICPIYQRLEPSVILFRWSAGILGKHSAMLSHFFILSSRGDTLIFRDCILSFHAAIRKCLY